jgi:hypothetical protein
MFSPPETSMRFHLRTLLIVLALGPLLIWACVAAYVAYRWWEAFPRGEPSKPIIQR